MKGSMRALIVGCTLLCRMPRCCRCVLAPVNVDAVDVAADDARETVVLLLLWFLVAVTTVATGAVLVEGALEFLVPTDAGVVVVAAICLVTHCDGKVAVRIGACRLMGRMSSSRLERGYRMYPPCLSTIY